MRSGNRLVSDRAGFVSSGRVLHDAVGGDRRTASQMAAFAPAISFFTWSSLLPQNEHRLVGAHGRRARATRSRLAVTNGLAPSTERRMASFHASKTAQQVGAGGRSKRSTLTPRVAAGVAVRRPADSTSGGPFRRVRAKRPSLRQGRREAPGEATAACARAQGGASAGARGNGAARAANSGRYARWHSSGKPAPAAPTRRALRNPRHECDGVDPGGCCGNMQAMSACLPRRCRARRT